MDYTKKGFYNVDCLEAMKTIPDKYFDLAIVDPPYGLGDKLLIGGKKGNVVQMGKMFEKSEWQDIKPEKEYFDKATKRLESRMNQLDMFNMDYE